MNNDQKEHLTNSMKVIENDVNNINKDMDMMFHEIKRLSKKSLQTIGHPVEKSSNEHSNLKLMESKSEPFTNSIIPLIRNNLLMTMNKGGKEKEDIKMNRRNKSANMKKRIQSPQKVMQKSIPGNMHDNTRKILAAAGVDDDVIFG